MKKIFYNLPLILILLITVNSCREKDYSLGDLNAPTNIVITTQVIGIDATHPNGDGSGDVKISISADNALSYKVDYDANNPLALVHLPTGSITTKYANAIPGVYTYRITAVVYGKGGTSSTATKDVTVRSDFNPPAAIVANLTGGTSKSWVVDKSIPGHFGVGPWMGSVVPEWWAAGINEKVGCCNCFYTATFTFTKAAGNIFTLQVTSPDGAFTKTGALAGGLPGIPGSGDEACYAYSGGTGAFNFAPASTGIPTSTPSTQVSIVLGGNNTFIGYGALQKQYEIMSLTTTAMYLRVQGTETGNAWYLKLKSL